MICHKDRTFCASSGHCENRDCDRWLNFGQEHELPISLAEYQDTEACPGYEPCAVMRGLTRIFEGD